MIADCRAICFVASLLFGATLAACTSDPRPSFPGSSLGPEPSPPEKNTDAQPPRRWTAIDAVLRWPSIARKPTLSEGHGAPRYEAEIRVSPEARASYAGWVAGAEMPAGAIVAELLTRSERSPGGGSRLVYGMVKEPGQDWRYVVTDVEGTIDPDVPTKLCARCHAEAVSDSIFGARADWSQDGGASSAE